MYSKIARLAGRTSAWRFSALSTVAFALGTAAAFLVVYQVVRHGIQARSDAWLAGEIEVLAEVAAKTSPGRMHERLMEEVAELARHEVLPMPGKAPSTGAPVFFLTISRAGRPGAWVGPGSQGPFLGAILAERPTPGAPWSLAVPGWEQPFRVATRTTADGSHLHLGFVDQGALALLRRIARTFFGIWVVMLFFGFAVSFIAARRILRRVERITRTAEVIGSGGLDRRMPAGGGGDEIARLSRTFNEMLDRIQDSVEHTHTMADAVAHDLRSPLTSIRGNLELAVTRGGTEGLREAAGGAIDGLDRLLATLNASLDVVEAGAGALRMKRRDVDLGGIAREMAEMYEAAAEERGLDLRCDVGDPVTAHVDPDLVRRVLANLLDNALKHLPPGCNVRVGSRTEGAAALLEVADNGPGFPPDVRNRAFERRAKGSASGGFGIGLALVRSVARAHGGDAVLLDPPGGGAAVRLSFPRKPGATTG